MTVEIKSITIGNGETLGYRERSGGEETLVLVHGNMTSSKHWDLLIDALDPKYKIYAVDMRGYGISTYLKEVDSIKDFSDDLKLLVDQLGLKDFAMMGWSTGGAVAMQFCADYPGYCQELILLASASTRGYPFYGISTEGTPDLNNRLKNKEDIKKDPFRTIPIQHAYDTGKHDTLKAIWNALIYRKKQPDEAKYTEYVNDMITQRNLAEVYHSLNTFNISEKHNGLLEGTNQVKDIKIPVLVLRGDEDLVVTDHMTKEILEDFEGRATYVELAGCGHSPLVDNLDLLVEQVANFLERKGQYEIKR